MMASKCSTEIEIMLITKQVNRILATGLLWQKPNNNQAGHKCICDTMYENIAKGIQSAGNKVTNE